MVRIGCPGGFWMVGLGHRRRGSQAVIPGIVVRHLATWDQTLTLLWFEDEELPEEHSREANGADEESALQELDGILPWPGKRRRR